MESGNRDSKAVLYAYVAYGCRSSCNESNCNEACTSSCKQQLLSKQCDAVTPAHHEGVDQVMTEFISLQDTVSHLHPVKTLHAL